MHIIVEEKIKEAMNDGEFDNLPGKGEPINLKEDLQGLSPEIRRAYKILKNAGYIPANEEEQKNAIHFNDLLHYATDGKITDDFSKRKLMGKFIKKRKIHKNKSFAYYAEKIYKKLF